MQRKALILVSTLSIVLAVLLLFVTVSGPAAVARSTRCAGSRRRPAGTISAAQSV